MRFATSPLSRPWWLILCCLLALPLPASAKDFKYQAMLVWASNAEKSPDPNHKPLDPEIRKKIQMLRWNNYFLVNSIDFTVPERGSKEISLSERCKLVVKDIDGKKVEASLIGQGKPAVKGIYSLPKEELLVLGGNAPDSTAWLVILRRRD